MTTAAPPNLLIIMVDQWHTELLDRHRRGDFALPNLDRLGEQAVRFEQAYCNAPICTPCRASFQLGTAVRHHGVLGNDRCLPPEPPTLPRRLNDAGYQTSYVGKWHLDPGDGRGWRRFTTAQGEYRQRAAKVGFDPRAGWALMAGPDAPHAGPFPADAADHVDGVVADLSRQELRRLAQGEAPFALMTSFYGPHAPYWVPQPWLDRIDPETMPLPENFDDAMQGKPAIHSAFRCRAWGEQWDESKWRRVRAAYAAYAMMLDAFIGQLLEDLDRSGAAEQTLVLFTADHGEMNGEHRMIYKGPFMYEAIVHVPALLHVPGRGGVAVPGLIETVDLTATLLGAAGVPAAEGETDGRNLWPGLVAGDVGGIGREYVISEFYEANWVKPILEQPVAMIRDQRHKLVATRGQAWELYDMHESPREVHNRIDDPSLRPVVQQLSRQLGDAVDWVRADAGAAV